MDNNLLLFQGKVHEIFTSFYGYIRFVEGLDQVDFQFC
jgi:hypothetical protein